MPDVRELKPGIQVIVCHGPGRAPQNDIYLLQTSEGLVMVDTSWMTHLPDIMEGLGALGWQPSDLKWILLTHAHPDHAGAAAGLVQRTGAQVAAHAADAAVINGTRRRWMPPRPVRTFLLQKLGESQGVIYPIDIALWQPPPVRVDRLLRDGDTLGGWQVIHSPGHTPGNISLYNPALKTVIAGNWLMGALRPEQAMRGPMGRLLHGAVARFMDFEAMRKSARRLAGLDFDMLLMSHFDPNSFAETAARLRAFGA